MEKMNCDIIRDLIPSYTDEICSEATKICVEEHIKNCSSCRSIAESCKNNMLSGNKLEQKSLDGLKNMKKKMKYQNLIYCLIIALLTFSAYCAFINTEFLSQPAYLVLFTICIFMTLLIGISYHDTEKPGKADYIFASVSFLVTIYIFLMQIYFIKSAAKGIGPFGLDLAQCGPFLARQFIVACAIQFAAFIYHFICTAKYNRNCNWLLCIDITGISLAQQYAFRLHSMDTIENFTKILSRSTFLTVIIGLFGLLASVPVTKYLPKKRQ